MTLIDAGLAGRPTAPDDLTRFRTTFTVPRPRVIAAGQFVRPEQQDPRDGDRYPLRRPAGMIRGAGFPGFRRA